VRRSATSAWLLKIGADDIGIDAFAVDYFVKIERVGFVMFAAEDNIIALAQPFGCEIVGKWMFALLKVALIAKDFGFDDRFLTVIQNQNISTATATGYFAAILTGVRIFQARRHSYKILSVSFSEILYKVELRLDTF